MSYYLWEMRPYFRQVAGQLVLGSITGFIMNTAVVLPPILLGWAIDAALAFERGDVGPGAVGWAALAFVAGTLLTEGPRMAKRWWLMTANARIRANIRGDALRGVIAWPMARLDSTPVGDVMARIIGDVEVLGVGLREFTIETWDTILFSLSLMVAMLVYDLHLTVLALLPVPVAMLLAKATGRWVASRTTASRQANASLTTALQEQLAGIRVLRLFGRTGAAVERVDTLSGQQAETNLALVRLRGGLRPVYTTLMTAGVLLVVWQGGEKVISSAMTVGAFIAYLELYLRFVNRGFRVPQMINSIQGGAAAYERLQPLLAPPHRSPASHLVLPSVPGTSSECRIRCLHHPPFPRDRWQSHCKGSPSDTRPPPLQRCATSGWTFRLAPWSRSQAPWARVKARWPGHCWVCTP